MTDQLKADNSTFSFLSHLLDFMLYLCLKRRQVGLETNFSFSMVCLCDKQLWHQFQTSLDNSTWLWDSI